MITIKRATKKQEVAAILNVNTLLSYVERRIKNRLAFVGKPLDSSRPKSLYLINQKSVVDAGDPWNVYSSLACEFEVHEWVSVEMRYSID